MSSRRPAYPWTEAEREFLKDNWPIFRAAKDIKKPGPAIKKIQKKIDTDLPLVGELNGEDEATRIFNRQDVSRLLQWLTQFLTNSQSLKWYYTNRGRVTAVTAGTAKPATKETQDLIARLLSKPKQNQQMSQVYQTKYGDKVNTLADERWKTYQEECAAMGVKVENKRIAIRAQSARDLLDMEDDDVKEEVRKAYEAQKAGEDSGERTNDQYQ